MTRPRPSRALTAAIVLVPAIFLAYFFLYPLVSITIRGLTDEGSFNSGVISEVFASRSLRGVAAFTLWQAIASMVLTMAVGLPTAWVFARFSFPFKRVLNAATLVPFVLPTLVVATAFLNLAGPRGIIGVDLTGSLAIILIAHVFYNFAVVVRGVGAYWARIDPKLVDAARSLGATPLGAFRSVTLPLLMPAIASTAALVFLFSFTSFGVVLVLGDISTSTIEVEIWRQVTAFLRLDVASTLAVLQIMGIGVVLSIYGHYERKTSVALTPHLTTPRRPRRGTQRTTVAAILVAAGLFLGLPLVLLGVRSLQQPSGGIGLDNYSNLSELPSRTAAFVDPVTAIGNSLTFAAIAVVIAVVIGVLSAVAMARMSRTTDRTFDIFVMLPLGTSAVTIGFGFLIALVWPVDIRTSLILIPIAHALVGIPFVVRAVRPSLSAIPGRLREAAATLGATPARAWWHIDRRLTTRVVLVGAAFAFAISMGEFGATTFIARPSSPTIPIAIFRYLGRPGAEPYGAAIALSVVLMAITGAAILLIDSLAHKVDTE